MKKILILIIALSILTKAFSMDKDIMRSMDDNQNHNQNQPNWSDYLPNELKQEIFKCLISSFLEERKFTKQTHDKINNIKLLNEYWYNLINTDYFFETLRKYINDNYPIPICLLALAKMVLPTEKYLKILNGHPKISFPKEFNMFTCNPKSLDDFIKNGGRLDLAIDSQKFERELEMGIANIEHKSRHQKQNILTQAISENLTNVAIPLIKSGALINAKDALKVAWQLRQSLVMADLIRAGANTNIYEEDNTLSLLMWALRHRFVTEDLVFQILEAGADVNFQSANSSGQTALMIALRHSKTANSSGQTALMIALRHSNSSGQTALMIALRHSKRLKFIQELVKRGADLNAKYTDPDTDCTVLMIAIGLKITDAALLLISLGADVNLTNTYGETALMLAASTGDIEVVKGLIKAGANINFKNSSHHHYHSLRGTALSIALENKHFEIVKILLDANAEITEIDQALMTKCFQDANRDNNLEVKQLLAKYMSYGEITKTAIPENGVIS